MSEGETNAIPLVTCTLPLTVLLLVICKLPILMLFASAMFAFERKTAKKKKKINLKCN